MKATQYAERISNQSAKAIDLCGQNLSAIMSGAHAKLRTYTLVYHDERLSQHIPLIGKGSTMDQAARHAAISCSQMLVAEATRMLCLAEDMLKTLTKDKK